MEAGHDEISVLVVHQRDHGGVDRDPEAAAAGKEELIRVVFRTKPRGVEPHHRTVRSEHDQSGILENRSAEHRPVDAVRFDPRRVGADGIADQLDDALGDDGIAAREEECKDPARNADREHEHAPGQDGVTEPVRDAPSWRAAPPPLTRLNLLDFSTEHVRTPVPD